MSDTNQNQQPKRTIFARFVSAQADFPRIVQDSTAKAFKSGGSYNYANISSILATITPILNRHGLCVMQNITSTANTVSVESFLYDSDGDSISSGLFTVSTEGLMQKGVQAHGSAVTYARRYSLTAFLGLAYADDDDDGAGSLDPLPPARNKPAPTKKPTYKSPVPLQTGVNDMQKAAIEQIKNELFDCNDLKALSLIAQKIANLGLPQCDELTELRTIFSNVKHDISNTPTAPTGDATAFKQQ